MPDTELPDIIIPTGLLPADGRFGSGPSKVRAEAVASLSLAAQGPLGTSHRQKPVRSLVGRLRAGLAAGIATLVTVSEYTSGKDFSGAAAVLTDLGEPDAPARTLAGPAPPSGIVDLAYLRALLASR